MTHETHAHPAHEILAEIAEEAGRNPEFWREFEMRHGALGAPNEWRTARDFRDLAKGVEMPFMVVRRRPRTVEINGWQVPEPVREPPAQGTVFWVANPAARVLCLGPCPWNEYEINYARLRRGLIHLTPEAAEAHGRALASFTSREDEG